MCVCVCVRVFIIFFITLVKFIALRGHPQINTQTHTDTFIYIYI